MRGLSVLRTVLPALGVTTYNSLQTLHATGKATEGTPSPVAALPVVVAPTRLKSSLQKITAILGGPNVVRIMPPATPTPPAFSLVKTSTPVGLQILLSNSLEEEPVRAIHQTSTQLKPTIIADFKMTRMLSITQEEIKLILTTPQLLQQLLTNQLLTITPIPQTLESSPQFHIQLFNYSIVATLQLRKSGNHLLTFGGIRLPLKLIQQALLATTELEEQKLIENHQQQTAQLGELFQQQLDQLDENISRIIQPTIREQMLNLRNLLVAMEQDESKNQLLQNYLEQTNRLLTAPPGPERDTLAEEYQQQALQLVNHPSPKWKALAISLMIIGASIAAIGTMALLGILTLGTVPSIVMAAGGTTGLLTGGVGLFSHRDPNQNPTQPSSDMDETPEATVTAS